MTGPTEKPRFLTAHEHAEQTCRTHAPQDGDVEVTASTFPTLHDAFEAISHDSGASAGHDSYFVPAVWAYWLPSIEKTMAAMDPAERDDGFVLGESSEVEALVRRRPELAPAHRLLNAFFDDFHGEDAGERVLRHRDGRIGTFAGMETDGRFRVQSLKGKGFWIFHPADCDWRSSKPGDDGAGGLA